MKQLLALEGLLLLGSNIVICAYGPCVIAPYYRGSWDVVSSEVVLKLGRTQVTSVIEGQDRQTFNCVQKKGNILLLKTTTDTKGQCGVICLLFGEMADAGVTIDRLNPVPMNGSIMDPQTIATDVTMTIDDVCRQTKPSYIRTAYIKRKRPGLCSFSEAYRGTWNSTLSGADHTEIKKNSLDIVFAGGFFLSLVCECRDHSAYLLRTAVELMNNMDGFMCVTVATLPTGKPLMTILQSGQFWNGALATVPHLQPLLLARDCPMEATPGMDVILYRD
ncbi:uncharacterized protein LOC110460515 [Mizuhopecten yessoensis]|uniref:Uncharacterized protein n=1 Tax=Mizuhopecten yessoensis TaxID=6573 RepID=A0A210Q299_MIZYE|nr:uncharacterized protein LOC110460515 [Mizuhopecten yessoensis]XP_021369140.1 uncharacterized protein LOC110460515 [Mizuhopecten yessoensis]OWF42867.1 hypothetical protein KP79_PYT17865 [Mizuhopecten yessoensis]